MVPGDLLASAAGVRPAALEDIFRLVGHASGSAVTEKIYRKQIRPILLAGAETMDDIFPATGSHPVTQVVTQLAGRRALKRKKPPLEPTTCSLRVKASVSI